MRARWIFCVAILLVACVAAAQPRTNKDQNKNKQLTQTPANKDKGRALYTNSHALIIGIDKYSKLPANVQLSFAKRDAQALKDVLVTSYGFPEANVRLLVDEQATLAGLRD